MFFCNSLAFLMIQRMLAIWSLVLLPFLKPAWTSGSSRFTYCWIWLQRVCTQWTLERVWREGNPPTMWVGMWIGAANCLIGKIPWTREWQPTPVLLPGESHGQMNWWAAIHGITKSWTQLSDPSSKMSLTLFKNENFWHGLIKHHHYFHWPLGKRE